MPHEQAATEPIAWLCELMMEDGTTRRQIVETDPHGFNWNDCDEGLPSPYRVTPLVSLEQAHAMVDAERERCAKLCDEIAERHQRSGRYVSVVADHAVRAGGQVDGADECARAIRGA